MYNIQQQSFPITSQPIFQNGVVIGKFMPFHLGHEILIKFARSQVKTLYVLVDNVPNELLTSEQRAKMIQDKFPDIHVGYFPEKMPQEPGDSPDFWSIWNDGIQRNVNILYQKHIHKLKKELETHFHIDYDTFHEKQMGNVKIDAIIAAMDYGDTLAKNLNAKFIPIDIEREIIHISATKIRNEPNQNMHLMSEKAKPYFTKKIAFIGAESTFKSTIAKEIRNTLHNNPTVVLYVPEFAKAHLKFNNGEFKKEDIEHIIKSQNNLINTACEYCGGYALCDSDALTTKIYSQFAFPELINNFPGHLESIVQKQNFHMTFLFKPDSNTPFVDDIHRKVFDIKSYDNRMDIFNAMKKELENIGRAYIIVEGSYQDRFKTILNYLHQSK